MVGKIILAILLGILLLAGVAFIGLIVALFTITSGNRSVIINAEIKEDDNDREKEIQ